MLKFHSRCALAGTLMAFALPISAVCFADTLGSPLVMVPLHELALRSADLWNGVADEPDQKSSGSASLKNESAQSTDPAQPIDESESSINFGQPGRWWLTLGGGVAFDFEKDYDFNLHVAASTFLATELEFAVELGGWYFKQVGQDTGGIDGSMIFRWHFLHDDAFNWSIYGDVGIGLLGAFDEVPDGGTGFNFTPRAGFGFTQRLDDEGTRLMIGTRWHHISNGRFEGDSRNPSRDSLMIYVGVMFPL